MSNTRQDAATLLHHKINVASEVFCFPSYNNKALDPEIRLLPNIMLKRGSVQDSLHALSLSKRYVFHDST